MKIAGKRFTKIIIAAPAIQMTFNSLHAVALAVAINKKAYASKFRKALTTLVHRNVEEMNGASEGIRTLDPNLGKVVLYP